MLHPDRILADSPNGSPSSPSDSQRNAGAVDVLVNNENHLDDFVRFFELSLDLFCIANMEGFFLRINPNFSKVLGHTEAELLDRPYLHFVHPDDQLPTMTEMQRLREGGEFVCFRNRYRDTANSYHVFEWTAKADAGIIYAVARNITTQTHLEEVVLNSKNRERAFLDHTPAVAYVKGIDHRYQLVNKQFSELFHFEAEAVIGKTDYDLFPPAAAARFIANDDEVARTGTPLTIEEQVPHDDGLHTYISVKFPLCDSRGQVNAVAGISTDISDRIRAQVVEQELKLGHVFQRTLYPQQAPWIPGLEIDGAAFPVSHVCGDYYDFIPLGNRKVGVSLGDVAGHGYKSALQMVELRTSLRILLRKTAELQHAVEELNEILCDDFTAVPSFVSFFVACIDLEQRKLQYIGAGHDAFVFKADGTTIHLNSTGLVLGVQAAEKYPEEAGDLPWEKGDVLVMFTDGFNEASNHAGAEFGMTRVLECLAEKRHDSARAMIDNLYRSVKSFAGSTPAQDDMTVVVVRATA